MLELGIVELLLWGEAGGVGRGLGRGLRDFWRVWEMVSMIGVLLFVRI